MLYTLLGECLSLSLRHTAQFVFGWPQAYHTK